ncbi:TonB-like [Hydrogenimonas sp.]|nr:TonB-like [Hydrogenimonas sp.]
MGSDKRLFFIGGVAAFTFYILLILFLILFFNDYKRSKRYVPAKSETIEVSILQQSSKRPEPKPKQSLKKERKEKVKQPVKKRPSTTSPKSAPAPKPKPISSLFQGIKASTPVEQSSAARLANAPKIKYKAASGQEQKRVERASRLVRDINLSRPEIDITSKSSGIGEVDEYMSRLYDKIYKTWQPEAIYAGEEAKVHLKIAPDGSFEYSLLFPSDNQGFNQSLIEYLERLKREKLPPPKGGRVLDVDIKFKAKE